MDLGEILDEVPLLQDLPYQDLATLADYMRAYRADPGTVLFAEGKHSDVMYFLVEGSLSVLKESEQGESRRLATIQRGKSVGEMSLIDHSPHSATVLCEKRAVLLQLSREGMTRLRDEHPRLAFDLLLKVAQLLSFRLRHTSGQLVDYLA